MSGGSRAATGFSELFFNWDSSVVGMVRVKSKEHSKAKEQDDWGGELGTPLHQINALMRDELCNVEVDSPPYSFTIRIQSSYRY